MDDFFTLDFDEDLDSYEEEKFNNDMVFTNFMANNSDIPDDATVFLVSDGEIVFSGPWKFVHEEIEQAWGDLRNGHYFLIGSDGMAQDDFAIAR